MTAKLIADSLVLIHFVWICFMLLGCVVSVVGLWRRGWLEWFWFRTIHLIGIFFVAFLVVIDRQCPLTIWENSLREHYDPNSSYAGSFIVHQLERLVYPDVNQLIVQIPTISLAILTMIIFFWRPPNRIRRLLRR